MLLCLVLYFIFSLVYVSSLCLCFLVSSLCIKIKSKFVKIVSYQNFSKTNKKFNIFWFLLIFEQMSIFYPQFFIRFEKKPFNSKLLYVEFIKCGAVKICHFLTFEQDLLTPLFLVRQCVFSV